MIRVLSLGAGVQSTTVLLMSCRGVLPKLDAAVFADTQWEPKAVYKHLAWLRLEAELAGIPVYEVTAGDLRQQSLAFQRTPGHAKADKRVVTMPLFVLTEDGTVGIIPRQCTNEYKIEPVEQLIRRKLLGLKPRQVAPAKAVEHWFGISADEPHRLRTSRNHWQTFRYPLVHDVEKLHEGELFPTGFTRRDCKDWLSEHGYPEPARSACIGCPFHDDADWVRFRAEDPEAWADAVKFDRLLREKDAEIKASGERTAMGTLFLHRSCVPLDQVKFRPKDEAAALAYGMQNECQGMCGV